MKTQLSRLALAFGCMVGVTAACADIKETFTSAGSTEYCVPQTFVRGSYDNLVIDYNLIVAEDHHFETGDVFVGARFKSRPEELWLLRGITWRRITQDEDLSNSSHKNFEELPLIVPVTVFYRPTDISAAIDDGEIWVGYGLRDFGENARVAFDEMVASQRYHRVWQAPPANYEPTAGVDPELSGILCIKTEEVEKTILVVTANPEVPEGTEDEVSLE